MRSGKGSETKRAIPLWGNDIVHPFSKDKEKCNDKVRGSNPRGGASFFLIELDIIVL